MFSHDVYQMIHNTSPTQYFYVPIHSVLFSAFINIKVVPSCSGHSLGMSRSVTTIKLLAWKRACALSAVVFALRCWVTFWSIFGFNVLS